MQFAVSRGCISNVCYLIRFQSTVVDADLVQVTVKGLGGVPSGRAADVAYRHTGGGEGPGGDFKAEHYAIGIPITVSFSNQALPLAGLTGPLGPDGQSQVACVGARVPVANGVPGININPAAGCVGHVDGTAAHQAGCDPAHIIG